MKTFSSYSANENFAQSKNDEEKLLQELAMLKADLMELECEYNDVSCEVDQAKSEVQRLRMDHDEKEKESESRLAKALEKLER